MIDLVGFENIPGFIREIDLAWAKFDRDINVKFAKWTKKVYKSIVFSTPQWSGDLASAWTYSINGIDTNYTPTTNKVENDQFWSAADVYERGMQPAVNEAIAKAAGQSPTWRDVVYIHNPAPIAYYVENLRVLIRPVNLIDGRVAMVKYHMDKFERGELNP